MNGFNWNAMRAPQKRKSVGFWIIIICRYIMPEIGLLMLWNAETITMLKFGQILAYGGLFLGVVGLGVYIWGIVGEDRPTSQKIVSILLSVGIFIGGWIGIACIAASLILSLITKKKSKQQDEQEINQW